MARIITTEETLSKWGKGLKIENKFLKYMIPGELIAGLILILAGFFSENGTSLYVLGGILIFVAVSQYFKSKENITDANRIKRGKSGEDFVTKTLKENLSDDYYIFNDLNVYGSAGKQAQIDHLIIGPNGFFALETKNYAGTVEGDAEETKLKRVKLTKEGKEDIAYVTNPITQNRYHIEVLKEFMQIKNINYNDRIISIVTLTNWNSGPEKWKLTNLDDTLIVRPKQAVSYIKGYTPSIPVTEDIIKQFIRGVV